MAKKNWIGINWTEFSTRTTNNLYTISFLNDSIGTINELKTTDGDNTWIIQMASQNFGLIYAQDTNKLIAALYYRQKTQESNVWIVSKFVSTF